MKWFIAKLIFNIQIDNERNCYQFDEQLRLIEASSISDAFLKAREIGHQQEELFLNAINENIIWRFIDVADIQLLHDLKHGVEIYSITHIDEEPNDYIEFIKQKAIDFEDNHLVFDYLKN